MSEKTLLTERLAAARKTISVLMDRTEHAIDTAGSLHNLFEDNFLLKKKISQHRRNEEELQTFGRALEQQVSIRTRELKEANEQLAENNRRLKEMVQRDGLTGLYNHSAMMEIIKQKIDESLRYQYPLSLVLLDLDYFKKINDTFGHLFGDHVLKIIAHVLKSSIRAVDYACRFGGEEFLLIFPSTDHMGAVDVAEKIRGKIERLRWKHRTCMVTVSAGVASFDTDTPQSLIAKADRLLYLAKEQGRNRVVGFDSV